MNSPPPNSHILTVALEDYFQVGAFNQLIQRGQWDRFETRLERNADRVLELLDRFGIHATFFVLGWVADRYPELVRKVAEHGHEIASKGYYHRGIRQMTPDEFREDLARAREALERAAGQRVVGYRVADDWFLPGDLWALDVLTREGYHYDSSIAPLFRTWVKEPFRRFVHEHHCDGKTLWEFPLSSLRLFGWNLPIAGGNYFRQFPPWLMQRAVARWHRTKSVPFVMYFHVWEVDAEQPTISAGSWLTRVRHYRNLDKMERILADYFREYRFTGIARYLGIKPERTASPPPRQPEVIRTEAFDRGDRTPVTVVVPCYNEVPVLPYLRNTLDGVRRELEPNFDVNFLFIDDGSKDETWSVLEELFGDQPHCTLIRHDRNRGVTAAILTGIRAAQTEVVCSIDADCTYDPHELARMIPLLTDGVDMVTASPYHRQGQVRNVPGWRLFLSRGASWLYRRVLRQKLATYTSCFRVYRRSAVANLDVRESNFLGVAEMLGKLDLSGGKIVEYPATLEVRVLGVSKMKTLRTIFGHLKLLSRLAARRASGRPAAKPNPPELQASSVTCLTETSHPQRASQ